MFVYVGQISEVEFPDLPTKMALTLEITSGWVRCVTAVLNFCLGKQFQSGCQV